MDRETLLRRNVCFLRKMDALHIFVVMLALLATANIIETAYTSTPGEVSGCIDGSATFTWVYDNQGDARSVVWDFGLINVFNYQASTGNTLPGASQFAGRVTHNGDGSITLNSLTTNDAGSYTCTTSYNSNPTAVDTATLTVNAAFTDSIDSVLTKSGSTATVDLDSQNGVGVEWKNTAGTVEGTGTTFTGDGTFTVCLTGCVSGSATACQQVKLGPPCGIVCIIIILVVLEVVGIASVVGVLFRVKMLPGQKEHTKIGPRAIGVIIGTALCLGIVVAVVILVVLKKCPCQKGSQNKNPDLGNSGTPMVESGNATNQGNETKDPLPNTDDKTRHHEVEPLPDASVDERTDLNQKQKLPAISPNKPSQS